MRATGAAFAAVYSGSDDGGKWLHSNRYSGYRSAALDVSGQTLEPVRIWHEPAADNDQDGPMNATATATTRYRHLDSPVGRIRLVGRDEVLTGLYLADHHRCPPPPAEWWVDEEAFEAPRQQLEEYFDGSRREFDVELDLRGSPFQVEVWTALRAIPYGVTTSYASIARAVGRPAAVRAVGAANGRNPISIIVPCHRVIGADGSLTGYGWGVDRKAWLLDHERGAQSLSGPG
jgi:methylated-DNA-[protein]-cysteine S-methyltransferase